MSESALPIFSSRGFIVSGLTFRSLLHLFLCIMLRNDLILLFFKLCSYPVFPALFLAGTLSNVYSCLLCHRLIDHRCMSLLLGFLFCSIDLYFYFHVSTILFLLLQLCSVVWSQEAWFLQLCFSFQRLEPIIQSEVGQKEKYQYSILRHIYGI